MEASYRIYDQSNSNRCITPSDIIHYMNMSIMAVLFCEPDMHKEFNRIANAFMQIITSDISGKSKYKDKPVFSHYVLSDLNGFLTCDIDHLKILSYKRHNTNRNSTQEEPYHWWAFPYDYLVYEDELLKVYNGETDHYEVDKSISPTVQDLMVAIELKVMELE